jgi:hypothetical protein
MKINSTAIIIIVIVIAILATTPMTFGINDAGHRTVIQYPTGTLFVRFEPGIYPLWFGTATIYRDVITFDFDKEDSVTESSIDQQGISVRYQDGGTGKIYGKTRFDLPKDEVTMISLHKSFRSNNGFAQKLLKTVTEEAQNLTAGLMTSEEAYTAKRGTFIEWSRDQLQKGKYKTRLEEISETDATTGKVITKKIPVIDYGETGTPVHLDNDLQRYGVTISGYQITDWNFEQKTLDQISAKREATMAIITAKANAERARQDAITAEEQGKAAVMKAKYEKEVDKEQAIVDAQKLKEVAIISAAQKVQVAEQMKLEAEQKKLAANEYKQEQILRGEGDGSYKRLVMQADGALQQKIDAYIQVNERYAEALKHQKWVPEVVMGSQGSQTGSAATDMMNLLMLKTARDLNLDMQMKK